jgi:hypothetical protein
VSLVLIVLLFYLTMKPLPTFRNCQLWAEGMSGSMVEYMLSIPEALGSSLSTIKEKTCQLFLVFRQPVSDNYSFKFTEMLYFPLQVGNGKHTHTCDLSPQLPK